MRGMIMNNPYKKVQNKRKFKSTKKELKRYDELIKRVKNVGEGYMFLFIQELKRRRSLVASEIGKRG